MNIDLRGSHRAIDQRHTTKISDGLQEYSKSQFLPGSPADRFTEMLGALCTVQAQEVKEGLASRLEP